MLERDYKRFLEFAKSHNREDSIAFLCQIKTEYVQNAQYKAKNDYSKLWYLYNELCFQAIYKNMERDVTEHNYTVPQNELYIKFKFHARNVDHSLYFERQDFYPHICKLITYSNSILQISQSELVKRGMSKVLEITRGIKAYWEETHADCVPIKREVPESCVPNAKLSAGECKEMAREAGEFIKTLANKKTIGGKYENR